jgi:hypothetical protein
MKKVLFGLAMAGICAMPTSAFALGSPKTFGSTTGSFTIEVTQPVVCGFTLSGNDFNFGTFDFNPGGYQTLDQTGKVECNGQNISVVLQTTPTGGTPGSGFEFLNYTGPDSVNQANYQNDRNLAVNMNLSTDGHTGVAAGQNTFTTTTAEGGNTFSSPLDLGVLVTRVNNSDAVLAGQYSGQFTLNISSMTEPTS